MISCKDGEVTIEGDGVELQIELHAIMQGFYEMLKEQVGKPMAKDRMKSLFDSALVSNLENENKFYEKEMHYQNKIEKGWNL